MTPPADTPIILLVPGHWLGAWAWDEVLVYLGTDDATALTLPGLDVDDPARATRTLDDQAEAIVETLVRLGAGEGRTATLVAHSGANGPVTLVLDRHPELIRRVVWVDSGPIANETVFAPDLPDDVAELPLPPFDALAQNASLDGLSSEILDRFRARAVPEPGPVLRQAVDLANPIRRTVPTTLVCCSLSSSQILDMARAGHPMFAEVASLERLEVIDLPTGHWPMWSRPDDLAAIIRAAAS